ncbi:MAG: hypothetical protein JST58_10645 [Bacteroidetes bacterium]|nr:hypothetical protein [Bacteroidota bacterium]
MDKPPKAAQVAHIKEKAAGLANGWASEASPSICKPNSGLTRVGLGNCKRCDRLRSTRRAKRLPATPNN